MTDKLEVTLLPCPFCGGEAEISYYTTPTSQEPAGHFIECVSCAAAGQSKEIQGEMPDRVEYAKAAAIKYWNTRIARQPKPPSADLVEAVAWLYRNLTKSSVTASLFHRPPDGHPDWTETPLYAAIPDTAALVAQLTAANAKIAALTAAGELLARSSNKATWEEALTEWKAATND